MPTLNNTSVRYKLCIFDTFLMVPDCVFYDLLFINNKTYIFLQRCLYFSSVLLFPILLKLCKDSKVTNTWANLHAYAWNTCAHTRTHMLTRGNKRATMYDWLPMRLIFGFVSLLYLRTKIYFSIKQQTK